ncbi:MAG: hypothetical protein QXJ74_05525 [Nitrososphaera sp.]|uniref:hypothetical protein n=1 Tax=Nitrososphaera sp. TaxID=1971748 RepID=UPI00185A130A|nr:hypothetical protein [Nitrososphaera sp.]NWG36038.1 hypothetical protein [Nitrososphaera sp.]
MVRRLKIDRAVYLVDDSARTYRFLERNPDWQSLGSDENRKNKKSIDGYTRIFRDGSRKVFRCR